MDNLKWWQKRKCDHRAGIRNVIFFKEKYAKKLAEFSTLYSCNRTYKLDYILKFQLKKKIPRALQFVLTIFCKKSKQAFQSILCLTLSIKPLWSFITSSFKAILCFWPWEYLARSYKFENCCCCCCCSCSWDFTQSDV